MKVRQTSIRAYNEPYKNKRMNDKLNKKENARNKRADAIESIAKCLEMTLRLSKAEYENLTCDEYKRIFGKWTLKELNTLWKIYESGI